MHVLTSSLLPPSHFIDRVLWCGGLGSEADEGSAKAAQAVVRQASNELMELSARMLPDRR